MPRNPTPHVEVTAQPLARQVIAIIVRHSGEVLFPYHSKERGGYAPFLMDLKNQVWPPTFSVEGFFALVDRLAENLTIDVEEVTNIEIAPPEPLSGLEHVVIRPALVDVSESEFRRLADGFPDGGVLSINEVRQRLHENFFYRAIAESYRHSVRTETSPLHV